MQSIDLLVHARWVLPVEPDGAVLEHHAVAVDAGRIVELGPDKTLVSRYLPREQVFCGSSHVLIPGFVNAHTSAAMSLLRGAPPRSPARRGSRDSLGPIERRWASPEFVRAGSLVAIEAMIRSGVTSFADMYLFPEEVARLAAELRIRIAVGLPVDEHPTPWASGASECLDKAAALWDIHKSDPWVRMYFAPSALPAKSPDLLARLRRIVDQLDAPLAMRLHETRDEIAECRKQTGLPPLGWLDREGLLRPGFVAVHANHLEESDLDVASRSGLSVIHCPRSNLRLGSGIAPVAGLRARGVTVALGTACTPSAGDLDVLAEAQIAALLASGICAQAGVVSSVCALRMATLNGATAIGLGAETGSLLPGKSADLVSIDLSRDDLAPSEVCDSLLTVAHATGVSDVWIAGRAHLRNCALTVIDAEQVRSIVKHWSARLGPGAIS